jgi:hypothetical protein
MGTLLMLAIGMSNCSSDDTINEPMVDENNVLLIQSDNGITNRGMMYKSGEMYNPPHCYLGKGIVYNDDNPITVYYMGFGANIKGSDVFDMLNINFESNKPMSFKDLKSGDTFDSSQFHASAAYTPTWPEAILREATALSGKVKVVGTSKVGDKSYLTLRLLNLRFDAIDHSCVYTVNGTVEYEIWE